LAPFFYAVYFMKKQASLFFALFCLTTSYCLAQSSWIFDDAVLPRVDILIDSDSLDIILLDDNQSDYEFPATFVFTKGEEADTVFNVGFRLRGNTSRASAKKSFKVSFNTFESGREYRGLDKMNLNGEHNDPTIMRAKLSWDIFEKIDIPAPRANHVKLYINDEYYGLYMNVEHIDDEFVKDRFGSDIGNLYKSLWPADLSYRGENPDEYKLTSGNRRAYELKTNEEEDDYSDLASLISFLENSNTQTFISEIERYINVDGVIRWMAIDILTGNWDNYWYNQNNYYLYFNTTGDRFEFIPYDYDNTFGIDWVGQDWGIRDINNWGPNGANRPLTNRILEVEDYRNRLNYYIDKFIAEFFNEETLFPEIDRLKALTEAAAEEDTYRSLDWGFDIDDYHSSFNSELGGHVDYGLKPYITTRVNSALEQVQLENIAPIFQSVNIEAPSDSIINFYVSILDEDIDRVSLIVPVWEGLFFVTTPIFEMKDDGIGIDKNAGDGIFSFQLIFDQHIPEFIQFYFRATDSEDLSSKYPTFSDITYELNTSINSIVINEFLADNESGLQDDSGAYEDWIELYNPTDQAVNLTNYFLTDDFSVPNKWALPDTTMQSGSYLLLWADNDDEEGILHTNFGLNNAGEQLGIYFEDDQNMLVVDTLSFGSQSNDISFGRSFDGSDEFVFFDAPTPGFKNGIINSTEGQKDSPKEIQLFQNYPNPFNPETTISFQLSNSSVITLEVFSIEGRLIQTLANSPYPAGTHFVRFDASSLSSGMYFYRLKTKNQSLTKRLVLIK